MRYLRKKGFRKYVAIPALAFLIFLEMPLTGYATSKKTQQQIDKLKEQQEETKEQLDDASQKKKNLEVAKSRLENYLMELNNQFAVLSEELTALEDQLTAKQEELDETCVELEEARQREEKQYKDMKKRIQFLYENGDMDYITLFLEAESFGDFLNRAEYATELVTYDRKMLEEFQNTKQLIEEKETLLTTEKEELESLQDQVTEKQEEVSQIVQTTGTKINQYSSEIAEAQKLVNEYEGKLEDQKSALDELIAKAKKEEEAAEKKKAQEAKAAAASGNSGSASGSAGNTNNGAVTNVQASELDMLAAIIYCEAGSESYEGQLAVGAVVMNRVRSGSFPNNIMGVIYQSGQFSPVASGRFIIALSQGSATASCRQAAQAAVGGSSNVGGCLYFRRNTGTIDGIVIGNHVFY